MTYPYKTAVMPGTKDVWWPISSDTNDPMVIGDGIPGDESSARLMARCCNIAYRQAVDDTLAALEKRLSASDLRKTLLGE